VLSREINKCYWR